MASGMAGRAQRPAEDRHEVFGAQLDLQLVHMDACPFQVRPFGRGGWMPIVGILQDDHHILHAERNQPVGDDLADDGAGRRGSENIVDALVLARRRAFKLDVAGGADGVVARVGINGRDLEALHHAHSGQAHRAVIDADDGMDFVLQDQPFHHQLSIFGYAFGIDGDDPQRMILSLNLDAAIGVDIGHGLLEAPVHADAAGHGTGRGQGHDAANEHGRLGKVAVFIGNGKARCQCQTQKQDKS